MLARLQQALTLGAGVLVTGYAGVLVTGYAGVLGLEFTLLRRAQGNCRKSAPLYSTGQIPRSLEPRAGLPYALCH